MTSKTSQNKELEKAKAELAEFRKSAQEQLDALPSVHRFEMAGECADKHGELTRVLEIDLDCEGVLGLFMELGQPYEFVFDKDAAPDDRVKKNPAKFKRFFTAMANVDLDDPANLKAVGRSALAKARGVADGFFQLTLVSDSPFELGTES